MTRRAEWRRGRRQKLARLERLVPARATAIGAGAYLTHRDRMLRSPAFIAATIADMLGPDVPDDRVWQMALSIDMFAPHPTQVRWANVKKSSGRRRTICYPDFALKVRQRVLGQMLVAQQLPHFQIFNWKGRGNMRQALQIKQAIEGGGQYVVVADVRNCFPSVKFDAIYGLDLLPEEVIRFASDSRYLDLVKVPDPRNDEDDASGNAIVYRQEQVDPRGLLQGLGSSDALWVALINDLPERLSGYGVPFIYCDNIAIVCETSETAASAKEALVRYFSDHRAGPLSLEIQTCNALCGFEHTGYHFDLVPITGIRSVMIRPTSDTYEKLARRLNDEVRAAGRNGITTEAAKTIFDREVAGFSAITDEWREDVLSSFVAEVNSNCPDHWA